ncbi:Mpo1 family 2-hydroxy fatty acid dioxygenase [Shewanella gaetbuli]
MKSAVEQLATYKSVHLNPKNIRTHFFGVPMIIWSLFVMLGTLRFEVQQFEVSVAMLFTLVVLVYYFILHARLAIGLTVFIIPVILTSEMAVHSAHPIILAVAVFAIGWVIQFIGHKYEKAKPAFIDDLNQLLIGPFFLMAEVYFLLGWEKELDAEITPIAREKRRAIEAARRAG